MAVFDMLCCVCGAGILGIASDDMLKPFQQSTVVVDRRTDGWIDIFQRHSPRSRHGAGKLRRNSDRRNNDLLPYFRYRSAILKGRYSVNKSGFTAVICDRVRTFGIAALRNSRPESYFKVRTSDGIDVHQS